MTDNKIIQGLEDADIVERWKLYRESMGSAMFGEVEPMAQEMADEIERLRDGIWDLRCAIHAHNRGDYIAENRRLDWRQRCDDLLTPPEVTE